MASDLAHVLDSAKITDASGNEVHLSELDEQTGLLEEDGHVGHDHDHDSEGHVHPGDNHDHDHDSEGHVHPRDGHDHSGNDHDHEGHDHGGHDHSGLYDDSDEADGEAYAEETEAIAEVSGGAEVGDSGEVEGRGDDAVPGAQA